MELYMSYYSVLPHYRLTHDISLDLISSDVESDNDANPTATWSKSTSEITHQETCSRKNSLNDNLTRNTTSEVLTANIITQNGNPVSCIDSPQKPCRDSTQKTCRDTPQKKQCLIETELTKKVPVLNSNDSVNVSVNSEAPPQPQGQSSVTAPSNLNCSIKKRTFGFNHKIGSPVVRDHRRSDSSKQSMVHLNLINKATDSHLSIKQDYHKNKKQHLENGTYHGNKTLESVRTELGSPQEITLEVIDKTVASPGVPAPTHPIERKPSNEAKVIENVQRNMRKRANVSKKGRRWRKLPQTPDPESPEALSPLPCMTKSLAEELLEAHSKEDNEVNEEDEKDDQLAGLTSMNDSFYGGKLGMCEDEGECEDQSQVIEDDNCEPKIIQLDENFFLKKSSDYNQYNQKNNKANVQKTEKPECATELMTQTDDGSKVITQTDDRSKVIQLDENFFLKKRSADDDPNVTCHKLKESSKSSLSLHSVLESKSASHMKVLNNEFRIQTEKNTTTNTCDSDVENTDRTPHHHGSVNGYSDIGNNRHRQNPNECVNEFECGDQLDPESDCQSLVRELNHFSDNVEFIDDDPGDNPKCKQLSEMMTLNFNTTSDGHKKAYLSSDNPYLQTDASPEDKPARRKSSILGLLGKKSSTESNHSGPSSSSPRSSVSDDDWDLLDATHRGCHKFVPRHVDEMPVEIGDPIHVFHEADDMWCEGINLKLRQKGIFPSVYATDLDFLENEGETIKLAKYTLHFLGSVEVNYHKGNDVICQAMQKVVMTRRLTVNSKPPSLCSLEINDYGIKMINKSKKNKRHSTLPKNNSIKKKIAKILSKDREGSSTNEQFFSLKNISFCGHHPRNDHYFAFITKHPLEMRFACHVFVAEFSTKPICATFGRAFKKFYQEYMAFAHPTEDIYME